MSKNWGLALAILLTLGAGLPTNVRADDMEGVTDRSGGDYLKYPIEPGSISGASICRGFWVRDNLKSGIPHSRANDCCTSGVKNGISR